MRFTWDKRQRLLRTTMKCVALVAWQCTHPALNNLLDTNKVNWGADNPIFVGLPLEINDDVWEVIIIDYAANIVTVVFNADTVQLTIQECLDLRIL